MSLRNLLVIVMALAVLGCSSAADHGPDGPEATSEKIAAAKARLRFESQHVIRSDDELKALMSRELDDVMRIVTTENNYLTLFQVRYWCAEHLDESLPRLIDLLTIEKFVGLKNTADLIIYERIATGDLQSYGHGGVVDDDLFCVSGRASWILKELIGQELGVVGMKTDYAAKKLLQAKWMKFEERRNAGEKIQDNGR